MTALALALTVGLVVAVFGYVCARTQADELAAENRTLRAKVAALAGHPSTGDRR